MREAARVRSIDVLGRFRASLIECTDTARLSLSNAESDIRRTVEWLRHDRLNHWQQQVRKRTRHVAEAKSELYRAELGSRDERPSCAVERKKLEKAKHGLAEAEEKIRRIHHWQRVLEREHMQYRGQAASLSGFLEREMPKASARLDRLQRALDAYVKLTAPASDSTPRPAADVTADDDPPDPPDASARSSTPEAAGSLHDTDATENSS